MSAYLVFTREKTIHEDELAEYSKAVPATMDGHEVKILALYGAHEDLEGPATEGTVILEFPTVAAAKAWYDGSPYRDVRKLRFHAAIYTATLVEGL